MMINLLGDVDNVAAGNGIAAGKEIVITGSIVKFLANSSELVAPTQPSKAIEPLDNFNSAIKLSLAAASMASVAFSLF